MFDNKNNEKNLIQMGTPETGLEHQLVYAFQNSFVNAKHITDQLLKIKVGRSKNKD